MKLTEKQAWKILIEFYKNGSCGGICGQVKDLYDECLINTEVYDHMRDQIKIEKIRLGRELHMYIWDFFDYNSRMKFCQLQYRKLKNRFMTETEFYLACKYFLGERLNPQDFFTRFTHYLREAYKESLVTTKKGLACRHYQKLLKQSFEELSKTGSFTFTKDK